MGASFLILPPPNGQLLALPIPPRIITSRGRKLCLSELTIPQTLVVVVVNFSSGFRDKLIFLLKLSSCCLSAAIIICIHPWPVLLFIHPVINPTLKSSIHTSNHHPAIYSTICPSIFPSTHPSIHPSIHPSTHPSIHSYHQFKIPFIYFSVTHPSKSLTRRGFPQKTTPGKGKCFETIFFIFLGKLIINPEKRGGGFLGPHHEPIHSLAVKFCSLKSGLMSSHVFFMSM